MDADRLRHLNDRLLTCGNDYSDVLLDGAAEIERLRAERDEMTRIAGKAVGEVIDLQAKIDALRAENERLRGWIASLDNEAEGLHQRLAAFADNNETLRARVAELEAENNRLILENTSLREACYGNDKRDGALRAENKQLQNLLRDANKGAELNSKVSRLWLDEVTALRARVAELARLVESAYAEGFYRAQQGGVDWDNRPNEWKGSHACAAIAKEGE